MTEICVRITEFTDPACPWAYGAEPFRHRLDWLYEGALEWEPQEVAVVYDVAFDAAREELGRVAEQDYVGADGFWRLNAGR